MTRELILYSIIALVFPFVSLGQTREKIRLNEGVDLYQSGSYKEALEKFENAYSENPNYARALYNAGNAAYLSGNFDTAMIYYNDYANKVQSKQEKAKAHFNVGNAQLQKAKIAAADKENLKGAQAYYQEAIKSYKESLKNNPNDPETKYNLTYALNQLQKNQQQQQQQQDQKDDKQDKQDQNQENKDPQDQNGDKGENGDKNPQDKNDQGSEKGDNQENKGEEKEGDGDGDPKEEKENQNGQNGQPGEENNQPPKEGQISKAQAIKDLDAINSDEGKILQKVYQKKGDKKGKTNSGKDW